MRKPHPKRGLAHGALALAGAIGLAMGTSIVADNVAAHAYTVADIAPSSEALPVIATSMTHDFGDKKPEKGATFTYHGEVAFTNIGEAGTTYDGTIYISAGGAASFVNPPQASDFKNAGNAKISGPRQDNGSYVFDVTGLKGDTTLTIDLPAKINDQAGPGSIVNGSVQAAVTAKPLLTLGGKGFVGQRIIGEPGEQCDAVQQYQWVTGDSGSWLADLKFADANGSGKVIASTARLNNATKADVENYQPNTINITTADGRDITAEVMEQTSFNPDDPSKPALPGNANTDRPGAQWQTSYNWPFDPTTWTGKVWLPAGTTVTVSPQVTYLNCLSPGLSTDFTSNRELAANLAVGRANDAVEDRAVDSFTLPGKVAPVEMCQDLVFANPRGLDLTNFGNAIVDGDQATAKKIGEVPTRTEGIAIPHASEYHNRLYYFKSRKELYYFDTKAEDAGLQNVRVGEISSLKQATNRRAMSAGFDMEDKLYFQDVVDNPVWYKIDPLNNNLTPTKVSTPAGMPKTFLARDIVFDSAGDAYVSGTNSGTNDRNGTIYKVTGGFTVATEIGTYSQPGINGLAFGKDGKLYGAGEGVLRRIDTETGELTEIPWSGGGPNGITDLTSCNTDKPTAGGDPEYVASKAAIDPVTGQVLQAGKDSTTGVSIDAKGKATTSYLVNVSNIGGGTGTPEAITDTIVAPEGFRIDKVQVKDLRTGKTTDADNNLTLQAGELGGDTNSQSWIVTVTFVANDTSNIPWENVTECSAESGFEGGKGFYNKITMDGDSDGDDNNDACIPAKPKTKIELNKRLIDNATGAEIIDEEETRKFNLSATNVDNKPSGVNGTSGISGYVLPGKYKLGETPIGTDAGYFIYGDWTCEGGTVEGNILTVTEGNDVSCTVTNTRTPKVHVVKDAADPEGNNPHVGKPAITNANGEVTVSYLVKVHNDSPFTGPGKVGKLEDYFNVPAGMTWDGEKKGTIEFLAEDSSGTPEGFLPGEGNPTREFAKPNGPFTITESITDMDPAGVAVFKISIPLKFADNVTEEQKANLAECVDTVTSETKTPIAGLGKGVPNSTVLQGEDFSYSSDAYLKDNIACVPVRTPDIHIEKLAADPKDGNAHIGKPVKVGDNGEVAVSYTIKVTNSTDSDQPVSSGAITDTFTAPAGLKWDGKKTAAIVDNDPEGHGTAEGFVDTLTEQQLRDGATIATSVANMPKGATHTFTITIPLVLDNDASDVENEDQPGTYLTKAQANAANLGECEDTTTSGQPGLTTTNKGVANKVTLAGEDKKYNPEAWEKDNIACVEVNIPNTFKVQKEAKTATGWASEGAPIKTEPTQTGYSVTTTYRVRVTNNGAGEENHPAITEAPSLPSPWEIDEVRIANSEAELATAAPAQGDNGVYTIAPAPVKAFGSREYFIQVHATANNVLPQEWEKIGECDIEKGGNSKLGAFNKVTMDGDTDGENNNDACVPVTPGESPKVPGPSLEKTDINGTPVAGAVFALYDVDPKDAAEPLEILQGTDGTSTWDPETKPASTFTMATKLERNKTYWIKELKSPSSEYTLLPVPLKFIAKDTNVYVPMDGMNEAEGVCPSGKPDCGEDEKIRTIDAGTYTMTGSVLKVADPRAGELPKAGGIGHWTLAGGAGMLILVSLTFLYRTPARRRA